MKLIQKGDEFLYNIARELDHILPGARHSVWKCGFAVLLPYATEEESTGSLKGYRNALRNDGNWGRGKYIQAYFTDVIYRGQEWNATQIIEYGIGHSRQKEPGGLRRFDINCWNKQEKADSGYHGDIHPPKAVKRYGIHLYLT